MSNYTGTMLVLYLIMRKRHVPTISYEDMAGNCYIRIDVKDDDYIGALNQMKLKLQKEGCM